MTYKHNYEFILIILPFLLHLIVCCHNYLLDYKTFICPICMVYFRMKCPYTLHLSCLFHLRQYAITNRYLLTRHLLKRKLECVLIVGVVMFDAGWIGSMFKGIFHIIHLHTCTWQARSRTNQFFFSSKASVCSPSVCQCFYYSRVLLLTLSHCDSIKYK